MGQASETDSSWQRGPDAPLSGCSSVGVSAACSRRVAYVFTDDLPDVSFPTFAVRRESSP